MRGSEMETLKDEELNKCKQAERERKRQTERSKEGLTLHNQRRITNRKALPTAENPPFHLPTSLLQVTQCEMESRATDTVVHSVNKHQVKKFRGRSYT